jgi:phosphoglycerate dehydrogenase-like enzyme
MLRIVFHGEAASAFADGFAALLDEPAEIVVLPDQLTSEADRRAYAAAEVVVAGWFRRNLPQPERLTLFHVPGAGYDAVDLDAVPGSAVVCNCFGHEQAIAEYAMAALLMRHVPLADADRRLRQKEWAYKGGPAGTEHDELALKTIGLLGFGHIGQAIAARAKAFEMRVHVANRSPVQASALVDRSFGLDELQEFWASADFFVTSVPLTPETKGIIGAEAFAAMPRHAVLINVGRGPTVDEAALFDALKTNRIAGAVIDTWYSYPSAASPEVHPSSLPFHELPNLVMTPHMSGWTHGTIRRRKQTIADNIGRRLRAEPCVNVVRPPRQA